MTPTQKPTPEFSYPDKFPPVSGYPIPAVQGTGEEETRSSRLFPEYVYEIRSDESRKQEQR